MSPVIKVYEIKKKLKSYSTSLVIYYPYHCQRIFGDTPFLLSYLAPVHQNPQEYVEFIQNVVFIVSLCYCVSWFLPCYTTISCSRQSIINNHLVTSRRINKNSFVEFARLERILQHKNVHSVVQCDYCGGIFKGRSEHRQHLNTHCKGDQDYSKKRLSCTTCGTKFKRRSEYRQHLLEHKLKNGDIHNTKCQICDKLFTSKHTLHTHMKIHYGKKEFLCTICGKEFLRKFYLDVHAKTHTEDKSFECEVCGKQFKHQSTFRTHSLVHTGARIYNCDVCTKSFKQSTHLNRHLLTHSGEKRFTCSFCGKTFAQNCNLKVHIRTHTGETPFHCSYCNKGFHDTSGLKRHEKCHVKSL